jgi:hypothetical protein
LTRHAAHANLEEDFAARMMATHPWVNEQNMARLFKQSIYYASKTGGTPR